MSSASTMVRSRSATACNAPRTLDCRLRRSRRLGEGERLVTRRMRRAGERDGGRARRIGDIFLSRRRQLDPRIRCSEKEEMVSTLNRGVRMRKRGERRKGEEKEGRRGGVKKPSNRWGRTRRHEAPEPYPTHHGRGGEETGRQSAGAVSSPRAHGT